MPAERRSRDIRSHGTRDLMRIELPSLVSVMTGDKTAPAIPDMSIEVDDVDAAVRESGAEIVHPLRDEEWGVRRFFVRDPNGRVVNVLGHR